MASPMDARAYLKLSVAAALAKISALSCVKKAPRMIRVEHFS